MSTDTLIVRLNESLLTVLYVSAPVLIAAVAVGLLVGLLQALTQIHDQTLPQAVKLVAVLVILLVLGPYFSMQIVQQASQMLDEFPRMTR
jgi:type III secretion protein S